MFKEQGRLDEDSQRPIVKLAAMRRERDQLLKENRRLSEEIMLLQQANRHMTAGNYNTSSDFPLNKELLQKISQFYKYDCVDLFFDTLVPLKKTAVVSEFFKLSLDSLNNLISRYFHPVYETTMQRGCLRTLQGPVMNVLRKSFQSHFREIFSKLFKEELLKNIARQVSTKFKIQNNSHIRDYLVRAAELLLMLHCSDPALRMDLQAVGRTQRFNSCRHDPIDGFVKSKEEVVIVLGQVVRGSEVCLRSLVIPVSYNFE